MSVSLRDPPLWIVGAIGVIVLAGFSLGIGAAGKYTLWVTGHPRPELMPTAAHYFLSSINGLLATHLGAYLGVSVATGTWKPFAPIGWLQMVAAITYALVLVAAAIFWWLAGFTEAPTKVVPILPEIVRAGFGVMIAILGAALGVQTLTVRYKPA